MNIKMLLIAMVALGSGGVLADGQVIIYDHTAHSTQRLKQVKNLRQLITRSSLVRNAWAPGTVIAEKTATIAAQQEYQRVKNQLCAWETSESGKTKVTINIVAQQLDKLRVTGRQFTSMDPDLILSNNTMNRMLDGNYAVYIMARPDTVLLIGGVSGAGALPWKPGQTIRDYLVGHSFLPGANVDKALLIDPSGSIRVAPIAYWNHRHVEAQPGTIIWVGFSSWSLPRQYSTLNQNIASILAHRIPD